MKDIAATLKPVEFISHEVALKRRTELNDKNEAVLTNKLKPDFIFIGDSIINRWEFEVYFCNSTKLILNRGVGGDVSYFAVKRFEADVLQMIPDYAVLHIGVNDMWAIDGHGGDGTAQADPWQAGEKVLENIKKIVRMAEENNQKLIICSILPTGEISWAPRTRERNEVIARVNEELKKISEERKLVFVDYHSEMLETDGITLREGLTYDSIHPHVLGYNVMAEVLTNTLSDYGITL